jgi:hypothetical protein
LDLERSALFIAEIGTKVLLMSSFKLYRLFLFISLHHFTSNIKNPNWKNHEKWREMIKKTVEEVRELQKKW